MCFGRAVPDNTDNPTSVQVHTTGVVCAWRSPGRAGRTHSWCWRTASPNWHTRRHQIGRTGRGRLPVLAPDQRGYGRSSCPADVAAYDIRRADRRSGRPCWIRWEPSGPSSSDTTGRDGGVERGPTVPRLGAAVAGLSAAGPRPRTRPTEAFGKLATTSTSLRFQEPGVADAELGADPRATLHALLAGAPDAPLPDWAERGRPRLLRVRSSPGRVSPGGLNWYRNMDRNWATTEPTTIAVPALFIRRPGRSGARVPRTDRARGSPVRTARWLDGAGHWIRRDHAADVNRILLDVPRLRGW